MEEQKKAIEAASAKELEGQAAKNEALFRENTQLKAALEEQKASISSATANGELAAYMSKNIALKEENTSLKAKLDEAMQAATKSKGKKTSSKQEKEARASAAKERLSAALGTKIKIATAAEKDDLQRISGVGPFIEKKLNDLGIFTFEQVSQFDEELVQVVTDAIQFFPGRIQRDDWVGQVSAFLKES